MRTRIVILAMVIFLCSLLSCKTKDVMWKKNSVEQDKMRELDSLISILNADIKLHKEVGSRITDEQIETTELALGLTLPFSYKYFLKEFGNGAYSLYHVDQPINGIAKQYLCIHRLGEHRKYLDEFIQSDGFGTFKTDSLLCLMTENSNGGAWCWITSENNENGEWSLAYYSINDGKLYYKVSNFTEWLEIATKCKGEVIRELDIEYRLGLG